MEREFKKYVVTILKNSTEKIRGRFINYYRWGDLMIAIDRTYIKIYSLQRCRVSEHMFKLLYMMDRQDGYIACLYKYR